MKFLYKNILTAVVVFILSGVVASILPSNHVLAGGGSGITTPQEIFGTIQKPVGVSELDDESGGEIGLLLFVSNLIRVATVIAGLWVMVNFVLAGYQYITSAGDSGTQGKVRDQITMSVVGLVLIVSAYMITALISTLLFGDPNYILNPTIPGPTAP